MPVDSVSWHDAVRFCIRRSMRDGFQNCYDTITNPSNWSCDITRSGYRLPTEAEWEFAYRAGTATRYWWGDSINGDYCWYGVNSGAAAHPVAKKLPNAWRLYDMAGNLWEWVNDWCCQTPSNGAINVTGPPSGATRIVRGGQYGNYNNGTQDGTQCLTAAFRYFENPASRFRYTGFRCVRTAP
jgi:formylglycine-generating enzyme required for sulfatase activity